jgi:hypothetical protein
MRRKHYSIGTEQVYIDWIKRFILYHDKRHPKEMAEEEVAHFLTSSVRANATSAVRKIIRFFVLMPAGVPLLGEAWLWGSA